MEFLYSLQTQFIIRKHWWSSFFDAAGLFNTHGFLIQFCKERDSHVTCVRIPGQTLCPQGTLKDDLANNAGNRWL